MKRNALPGIKRTFRLRLLACVVLAFAASFAAAHFLLTRQARRLTGELLTLKLEDASEDLSVEESNRQRLERLTRELLDTRAGMVAETLKANPKLAESPAALRQLGRRCRVDEIRLESTAQAQKSSAEVVNSPFAPSRQTAPSPDARSICARVVLPLGDGKKRFVSVGFSGERLREAVSLAASAGFSEDRRIGRDGGVLIVDAAGGILVNGFKTPFAAACIGDFAGVPDSARLFEWKTRGRAFFGMTRTFGNLRLIALLPQKEAFERRDDALMLAALVSLVLFAAVYWLVSRMLDGMVLNPIAAVLATLEKIASGDLGEKVEVRGAAEFSRLSDGINTTVDALKRAIAEAERRFAGEMQLASAIQNSVLPHGEQPFSERCGFRVCGRMKPAKEIGGDFFDYFMTDEEHLAFLVADVSEKGVPAALFMMSSLTWMKGLALSGLPPEKVFNEANRRLAQDNEPGMFVTVFYGVLTLKTGKLICVNAGHNPPLLRRAGGKFSFLRLESDFILGALPETCYHCHELSLSPGDELALYTDGATDEFNALGECFGVERLRIALEKQVKRDAVSVSDCDAVFVELDAFRGGVPQFDDETLLLLRFGGEGVSLKPDLTELSRLSIYLDGALTGVPESVRNSLQTAAEEIFVNIVRHGKMASDSRISFTAKNTDGAVELEFRDRGIAFDPTRAPEPQLSPDVLAKGEGGLGVFLARRLMDEMHYRRENGENILELRKKTAWKCGAERGE